MTPLPARLGHAPARRVCIETLGEVGNLQRIENLVEFEEGLRLFLNFCSTCNLTSLSYGGRELNDGIQVFEWPRS
jgi:hypothetical protein